MKIEVNEHGTNKAIKFHILPEKEMRLLGFTDYCEDRWSYFKDLGLDITFNVIIPKDGSEAWIDVLDDSFGQPYDYQSILEDIPDHKFALSIKEKVEECMKTLTEAGVISGHKYGEYI